MQFTTTLFALAAAASAAALPRTSPLGYWNAQMTISPDHSVYVTAQYYSDSYPEGLRSACISNPFSDPPVDRCDRAATSFTYDGIHLNLTQTVEEPNQMTVFGSKWFVPLDLQDDNRVKGETTVEVTSAIA